MFLHLINFSTPRIIVCNLYIIAGARQNTKFKTKLIANYIRFITAEKAYLYMKHMKYALF